MALPCLSHVDQWRGHLSMRGQRERTFSLPASRRHSRRRNATRLRLKLVGCRSGFFRNEDEEIRACGQIVELAPDILWVSMGVPREQRFIVRHRHRLTSVGVIKTSGGLFDFLAGFKPRAPVWMQDAGLEWAWRACLEPKRLGWRYLKTNPLALYLLLAKSG